MTPAIWAILLAKRFDTAKSRLGSVLSAEGRAALARAMFDHVLGVLVRSPSLSGVVVVTDSSDVARLASERRAAVLRDPASARTLADLVDFALDDVSRRGATDAVVFVSDLPEVTDGDLAGLIRYLATSDVVLARDSGGAHTNALAVRRPAEFRTSFGADDSFRRHRATAERAGLSVKVFESPTLAFDVDTPEDYARLGSRR